MDKQEFIETWGKGYSPSFEADLNVVIAYEIEKAKDKPATNPIREAYDAFKPIRVKNWLEDSWIRRDFNSKSIDQSGIVYENENDIINFDFDENPEKWEIYEPEAESEKVTDQVKPKFDQDRFEAMFRAVVISSPHDTYERCMEITNEVLKQLDAFYAKKKGGCNE